MSLIHHVAYIVLWAIIWVIKSLKSVKAYLSGDHKTNLPPTVLQIHQVCESLKKWNHIGFILDKKDLPKNGLLSSQAIADLASVAVLADSTHTSIFLPQQLTLTEIELLKSHIIEKLGALSNNKKPKNVRFVESIYSELTKPSMEEQFLDRIKKMMDYKRKCDQEDPSKSGIKSMPWGVSGTTLAHLTSFESTFKEILTHNKMNKLVDPHSNESQSLNKMSSFDSSSSNLQSEYKIMFVSPFDGKASLVKITELLAQASRLGIIRSSDIDQALIHALISSPEAELWPSPELVINFKESPITAGFPIWQLRYAEIVNIGPLQNGLSSIWNQFHSALNIYSKTVQRFGK